MSYGTVQAEKMTTESGYSLGAGNASSFKNRIINGGMVINQRAAASSNAAVNGSFYVDRFVSYTSTPSDYLIGQNLNSITPPAGFQNYLGIQSSIATSPASGDYHFTSQKIEGYNWADLGWGSASAKSVTISFWARSSLTGTFGGAVTNGAANRSYPFTYVISAANTWEYQTVTVPGDTSGTWLTTDGIGVYIRFGYGTGSSRSGTAGAWAAGNYDSATGAVSVTATSGATWYLTGVQVEVGTVATSFDFRSYGTELALCQRYLPAISYAGGTNPYFGAGMAYSTTAAYYTIAFPVTPRVPPTGLTVSSASHFAGFLATTATSNATAVSFGGADSHSAFVGLTGMSGLVAGNATLIYMSNSSALMLFTGCEL